MAPTQTFQTFPSPPAMLTPPSTAAVIQVNSVPAPTDEFIDPLLDTSKIDATATKKPHIANEITLMADVFTPESLAASPFPPNA